MENKNIKIKKISLVLLIVAVLIKFLLLALPGHYGDLFLHQEWGNFLINHSPTEIYHQTPCNLPPFWIYILWFFAQVHHLIAQQPLLMTSEAIKMPGVFADLAIGLVIFYFLLKKGVKEKIALLASLFFILNPFVVYNSSIWGQLDSTYTFFALLAFVLLDKRKVGWASIFLALSFLTKLQGVIFVLLFFFLVIKKFGFQKTIFSIILFLLTIFIVILPFFLNNVDPIFIFQKTWLVSWHQAPVLSVNSFNFWWPIQAVSFNLEESNLYLRDASFVSLGNNLIMINFKMIGLILFSIFYFIILIKYKKNIYLLTSLATLNFFMIPTNIHERYIFPFFAFFSIFWAINWLKEKKYLLIYFLISLISFLNLIFAMFGELYNPTLNDFILKISPALALINFFIFIYLFFILIKKEPDQLENKKI